MRLTALNPEYDKMNPTWTRLYHAYEGEQVVKSNQDIYLPKTVTMKSDKDYYLMYLERAVFPDFFYKAVESFQGALHREKAKITLPDIISFMKNDATFYGESLQKVLEEITHYLLRYGRACVGVDVRKDEKGGARPYIVIYPPNKVKNWGISDTVNVDVTNAKIPSFQFVIIDESGSKVNESGEWVSLTQHRVLEMINGVYHNGVFQDNNYDLSGMVALSTQSGTLNRIPFVFCNVKDLKPDVQRPPLVGLANLCFAIYRGDADYRQDLHRQSQDTLFTFGIPRPESGMEIGAGAIIEAPADGRAEYVGVTGVGLEEQRIALDNLKTQALHDAGQFMNTPAKQSAEGISLFLSASMSALHQVANSSAECLKVILSICCEWLGKKDVEIEIVPNTDFSENEIVPDQVLKLWTTVQSGGLSRDSYFTYLNRKGIIETSPDDEIGLIDGDKEQMMLDSGYGNPLDGGIGEQGQQQWQQQGQSPTQPKEKVKRKNENAVSKN
jgi:hypothetical protein